MFSNVSPRANKLAMPASRRSTVHTLLSTSSRPNSTSFCHKLTLSMATAAVFSHQKMQLVSLIFMSNQIKFICQQGRCHDLLNREY